GGTAPKKRRIIGLLIRLQVFLLQTGMDIGQLQEVGPEFLLESRLTDGENTFAMGEDRLLLIDGLQVKRDQTRHPATAMDDIGRPAELLHRLQGALAIEHRTQTIVIKP